MPSFNEQMVLARGNFIAKQENAVWVGQIGTGKTHLSTAIGYAACELG